MTERSIKVSNELYNLVQTNKRPDETFEQALDRLMVASAPLTAFSGALRDVPDAELAAYRDHLHQWRAMRPPEE